MSNSISAICVGENPTNPTFKCINEISSSLTFEISNHMINSKAIELLKNDSSTKVMSIDFSSIQFEVNMHQVKRVTKFKQLEQYKFNPVENNVLKNIRSKRNGSNGRDKSGRIKTNFEFSTLYDWFKDGRTRSTKSISIKTKRKERKFIGNLASIRSSLLNEKQGLINEISFYISELQLPET